MDREAWRQRLLKAKLPEEVVDAMMAQVKDEDLVRMKDMSEDEILEVLRKSVEVDDDTSTDDADAEDDADADDATTDDLVAAFKAMEDSIITRVEGLITEITVEVEVPQLEELKTAITELEALKDSVASLQTFIKDFLESDEDRLGEIVRNLSPASRTRLRRSVSDDDVIERLTKRLAERNKDTPQDDGKFVPTIKDSQGNSYLSLAHMARNEPIQG